MLCRKLFVISLALVVVGAATPQGSVVAIQPDAPFIDLANRNREKWIEEDRQINAKLATLHNRFGKRPNIIYILADDVGWGEMGWQGGGKHRGTPTPTLDRLRCIGFRGHSNCL
jgi:hypothetical protein